MVKKNLYKKISGYFVEFLRDLAGEENFTYEISCCGKKRKNVFRYKDPLTIAAKVNYHAAYRDIFISPYNSRYPVKSRDFVYGRQMVSSNCVVIDIDSKNSIVDYRVVLSKLTEHNIQKPTYMFTSGKGCHLWYILDQHIKHMDLYERQQTALEKFKSINWPNGWKIDELPITQQFRMPFTINHNYNKIVTLVYRGEKIKIKKRTYKKPTPYTKKELKKERKIRKLAKELKKPNLKPNIKPEACKKNRFLEGSESLEVILKQEVYVNESRLKRIIQLLSYGKSFLSCRIAGEALGVSHVVANKFLRTCVALGYLKIIDTVHSANSYEVLVDYEVKKKKSEKGRCHITGPGQSNRAMCRLARQIYVFKLNFDLTVNAWLRRYYDVTSREHSPEELVDTCRSVLDKFEDGLYEVYGST